jgi:hypothetical protein
MDDRKNLKVSPWIHQMLVDRAKTLGMKYYVLADAIIEKGLREEDPVLQTAVASLQRSVKQQTTNTSQEPQEE